MSGFKLRMEERLFMTAYTNTMKPFSPCIRNDCNAKAYGPPGHRLGDEDTAAGEGGWGVKGLWRMSHRDDLSSHAGVRSL